LIERRPVNIVGNGHNEAMQTVLGVISVHSTKGDDAPRIHGSGGEPTRKKEGKATNANSRSDRQGDFGEKYELIRRVARGDAKKQGAVFKRKTKPAGKKNLDMCVTACGENPSGLKAKA